MVEIKGREFTIRELMRRKTLSPEACKGASKLNECHCRGMGRGHQSDKAWSLRALRI